MSCPRCGESLSEDSPLCNHPAKPKSHLKWCENYLCDECYGDLLDLARRFAIVNAGPNMRLTFDQWEQVFDLMNRFGEFCKLRADRAKMPKD